MNKQLTTIKYAALFAAICAATSVLAASEEKVTREFDVQPNGKLIVDVDFGTIDVEAGAENKANVDASRTVEFGDQAAEKDFLAAAPIVVSTEGNTVIIRARRSSQDQHEFSWHHTRMDAHYKVHVPKTFAAELHTGGGRINVARLAGEVRADSGGGEQKFSQLQGRLNAHSGGGSVKADGCHGAIDISTGGGQIAFVNGEGNLRAHTGGGEIEVRNFIGDTDVKTGGGEVVLEKIDGAIEAATSGGSITASVSREPVKRITLESSGGSIELSLPKAAAVDVQARTSAGRIRSDLPFQVTHRDDDHLEGKLNGGGAAVVLRTSSGDIEINANSAETASR